MVGNVKPVYEIMCRSQWPPDIRHGFVVALLLDLRVRIPAGTRLSACCECSVLSGGGLCVGLITRPEESYRMWCVWVWSWILDNVGNLTHWGLLYPGKKNIWDYIRMLNSSTHAPNSITWPSVACLLGQVSVQCVSSVCVLHHVLQVCFNKLLERTTSSILFCLLHFQSQNV